MKIAIASQNQTSITGHLGKCRRFWIYEIEDKTVQNKTFLELTADQTFHNSPPDAPHLLDDVAVVIGGSMGNNLARRLENQGIEAIATSETDIDKAVGAYLDGTLIREAAECQDDDHHHNHQGDRGHRHRHRHGRGQQQATSS